MNLHDQLMRCSDQNSYTQLVSAFANEIHLKEPIIRAYLEKEYSYNDTQVKEAIDYLMQVEAVAFEFVYYLEHGSFVPELFAYSYKGYSAKKIWEEFELTIFASFNYMIFFETSPREAMAYLKKGMPRK